MRKIIYNSDSILLDEGVFFSKGVFETILWIKEPIFLDEHIERLKKGMREIGLLDLEEDKLRDFLSTLTFNNKSVKITVTPLNIIITSRDIPYKEGDYKKGFSLKISSVRRNSTSRLCYIKSTGYIENILEKSKANEKGFNDSLFLNENGLVSETSCANIFIIKDNHIITPRIEDGLLNGIIREWIINNFEVNIRKVTLEDLKDADEVFITNSLVGIMPIVVIDNYKYSIGKITEGIRCEYENYRLQGEEYRQHGR